MAAYRLGVVASIFLAVGMRVALAGELNQQQLDGLTNVVEKVCKTVSEAKGSSTTAQIEGTIQADLPGLLKKFLDISASSTGKIGKETYEGLSREATATAMESSLQCRERLFSKVLDKLSQNEAPSDLILSGRDTNIQYGLDVRKTGEVVKEAIEPYREQLSQLNARVDQVIVLTSSNTGVPISLLQLAIQKVYGDKINTQDALKMLVLVDRMAEDLLNARQELLRLKTAPQTQVAMSECDHAHYNAVLKSLDDDNTISSLDYHFTLKSFDYRNLIISLDYNDAYRDIFGQGLRPISMKYDILLRTKMEEWTRENMLEDQANTTKPSLDPATQILDGIEANYRSYVAVMMHPNPNSCVVISEEVQILVRQWQTITDMTSQLSMDINDMAMSSVRSLR